MRPSVIDLVRQGCIAKDWSKALQPVEAQLQQLDDFLEVEHSQGHDVLPERRRILAAFAQPLAQIRVVIVGQDPYPTSGHPIGHAFAVQRSVRPLPRSLNNIYRELHDDLGIQPPEHGDLSEWTKSGVMLLNRVLTVRSGEPASHKGKGWEEITTHALKSLVHRGGPLVAVLWGNQARNLRDLFDGVPIIESAHPSPLAARRGFFGSKPFSRVNQALINQGAEPIDWRLSSKNTLF